MTIIESYHQALQAKGYQADSAQENAVTSLQRLADELQHYEAARQSLVKRWFSKPEPPRSIYLWGGVGRGKSFLMALFYHNIATEKKSRLDFHGLMRAGHQGLKELNSQSDRLDAVANDVADRYRLICFDGFHVSDIAYALILSTLLQAVFRHAVCFIMTSNYAPYV